jgi:hypothetical protein
MEKILLNSRLQFAIKIINCKISTPSKTAFRKNYYLLMKNKLETCKIKKADCLSPMDGCDAA